MADQSITFKSINDVELGDEGTRDCEFKYVTPAGQAKGLVIVVPGFGEDVDNYYNTTLRRHIAGKHGMVAMTVDYHCCKARPPAARVNIEPADFAKLIGNLYTLGRADLIDSANSTNTFANAVNAGVPFELQGTMIPPNGHFQNFGVLQAIDHINAVYALQDHKVEFDPANIVAIGTSHGAYIAHLIMKFAPNLLSGIIDNSAYTECGPNYVGLPFEVHQRHGGGLLKLNTQTKWQHSAINRVSYFGTAQRLIRDLAAPDHLATVREKSASPCQIHMLNSVADPISPIGRKERQARRLEEAGFAPVLEKITETEIDGIMLKSLGHGMEAGLNGLADKYLPGFKPGSEKLDRDMGTDLAFTCAHSTYRFEHKPGEKAVKFSFEAV